MKSLILVVAALVSASAFADAPSKMIKSTLDQGVQILSLKSTDARNQQMCALIKGVIDGAAMTPGLLGSYAQISTDQAGVKLFTAQIPSLITSQLISRIGSTSGTQIDVDDRSEDQGNGTFAVGVNIHTSNGNAYSAKAIVVAAGKSYRLVDVSYMGFSVVSYLGGDIQQKIDDEANSNPQHPVTAFVHTQMADTNYINCN